MEERKHQLGKMGIVKNLKIEKREEYDIGVQDFNGIIVYDNLNPNKVYAQTLYRTFFMEFETIEQARKWGTYCNENVEYAFYDCMHIYDLKGGERDKFINQFIKYE